MLYSSIGNISWKLSVIFFAILESKCSPVSSNKLTYSKSDYELFEIQAIAKMYCSDGITNGTLNDERKAADIVKMKATNTLKNIKSVHELLVRPDSINHIKHLLRPHEQSSILSSGHVRY